jgi:hypothetical protein
MNPVLGKFCGVFGPQTIVPGAIPICLVNVRTQVVSADARVRLKSAAAPGGADALT